MKCTVAWPYGPNVSKYWHLLQRVGLKSQSGFHPTSSPPCCLSWLVFMCARSLSLWFYNPVWFLLWQIVSQSCWVRTLLELIKWGCTGLLGKLVTETRSREETKICWEAQKRQRGTSMLGQFLYVSCWTSFSEKIFMKHCNSNEDCWIFFF